ncbi:MAG: dUTP diphosphatase [Candidatus Doudnabacteria bacterium]|nr:dUTP diphosphatase [Candidatus Doudnabacteria bacterium]
MKVKIKRLDPSIEIPKYHTKESAGFDLASSVDISIAPGEVAKIPTGLVIASPSGYFLLITSRSSLALKKGLNMANGVGVIDPDYAGPNDQVHIIVQNFTDHSVEIQKGERLAQGIFLPIQQVELEETDLTRETDRGGIGSTGGYKT